MGNLEVSQPSREGEAFGAERDLAALLFHLAEEALALLQGATDTLLDDLRSRMHAILTRLDVSDHAEAAALRASSDAYSLDPAPLSRARMEVVERALIEAKASR